MKEQYQHIMEQVTLDDRARASILNRLEAGQPRRRVHPLRTALIAACVCLALVGTAFAGKEMIGVQLSNLFHSGYDLNIKGLVSWTNEQLGQQMVARYRTPDQAESPDVHIPFSSWSELEEYVGLSLADNPVLEAGARWLYPTDENDLSAGFSYFEGAQEPDAQPLYRYYLDLRGDNDQISEGYIGSFSTVDGVDIRLDIRFWGEHGEPASSLSALYGGANQFDGQSYTMRNGTQAQLMSVNSDGYQGWNAFFVQDGNLYVLTFDQAVGQSAVDINVIHQVLDAFE